MSLDCCFLTSPLISPSALSYPTCRFAPNLRHCLSAFSLQFSATALSFSRNPLSTPHPLLPPHPYFRLPLLLTYPRVSPAYFLRTPRVLRVTRSGPPEKVGNVNCVHGNRACHYLRSFIPTPSNLSFPHLSISILLSLHTTTPCPHHLSAITRM